MTVFKWFSLSDVVHRERKGQNGYHQENNVDSDSTKGRINNEESSLENDKQSAGGRYPVQFCPGNQCALNDLKLFHQPHDAKKWP